MWNKLYFAFKNLNKVKKKEEKKKEAGGGRLRACLGEKFFKYFSDKPSKHISKNKFIFAIFQKIKHPNEP